MIGILLIDRSRFNNLFVRKRASSGDIVIERFFDAPKLSVITEYEYVSRAALVI